jgi:hypothetical protein
MNIKEKIQQLGVDRFDLVSMNSFLERFDQLSTGSEIIDSILQISTDEGDELEIGFFTKNEIVDITLSRNKVYSYSYPLSKIKTIQLSDNESKWILTIIGEKKYDYNVVKPGCVKSLKKYEESLRQYLKLTVHLNHST